MLQYYNPIMRKQGKGGCTILKNTYPAGLITYTLLSAILVIYFLSSALIPVLGAATDTTILAQNETKSPLSATTHLNSEGFALLKSGKYNESLAYFDKALALNPNSFNAMFGKARAILYLGKYNESLAYFDKALAINPNSFNALDNKATALLRVGKYNESLPYFDKALAINPNFIYALVGKGIALVKVGNYNESLTYFDKALAINPQNPNALNFKKLALGALNKK